MGRWFFLGLVLVSPAVLAACPAAPPAGGALPAAVQYRVEGPAVSLQAQELSNPTPWAEKGDYWLVYQDPVTIGIDLPFRPDGDERARLETRIRQSLQGAGIRDLDWAGHRVRIDLDLPPGIHQLALGGIEGLERAGLDRALWLERTRRYEVMAWKPGVPASAAERAAQLDLPAGAEGVGPVVADRDFLVAGGNLQGPVDLLRTLWSWTPGASEATALPGVYAVNTARWITQDRLWVAHEAHLVVDVTTGAVEPAAAAGAADVAVHPDGRTALFEVVLDDGDAWPRTWRWRLAVRSPAGQVLSRWDLFSAGTLEVVPWLEAWWGPDGITFTRYTSEAGDTRWWLSVVDPETGDVRTLAGPVAQISGLGGGQYLLVAAGDESAPARWQVWRPGTGLVDVTLPGELERRVPTPRVHSLWGEWMVFHTGDAADPHVTLLVAWRVASGEWLELGPVQPLGWHQGKFYWLQAQGGEP